MIFTFLFFYFFSARSADALPPPPSPTQRAAPLDRSVAISSEKISLQYQKYHKADLP